MQIKDFLPDKLEKNQRAAIKSILHDYDIAMVSCLYWHNNPPWRLSERRVWDSFLLFPFEGSVRVELDDERTHTVSPGEFMLLADGTRHTLQLIDGCPLLEQVALHCHIQNIWKIPLLAQFTSPVLRLPHPDYWKEALLALVSSINHDPALGQLQGETLIRNLLVSLVIAGDLPQAVDKNLDPRISHALQTIHDQYPYELTVEMLAGAAQLSAVQFRKLFLRQVGDSPKAYIGRYRLKAASRLLRGTSKNIKQIAYETGFHNENYFHTAFRKAYSCTPTEYRFRKKESV